jgi:hypothetical protein
MNLGEGHRNFLDEELGKRRDVYVRGGTCDTNGVFGQISDDFAIYFEIDPDDMADAKASVLKYPSEEHDESLRGEWDNHHGGIQPEHRYDEPGDPGKPDISDSQWNIKGDAPGSIYGKPPKGSDAEKAAEKALEDIWK